VMGMALHILHDPRPAKNRYRWESQGRLSGPGKIRTLH
jgi:hypothetical protein